MDLFKLYGKKRCQCISHNDNGHSHHASFIVKKSSLKGPCLWNKSL